MKRILLFLATQKGHSVLQAVLASPFKANLACVVSFHEIGVRKDYCDELRFLCEQACIPFFLWNDVKGNLDGLIESQSVTSIIAISWRYLLPLTLNERLEDGIIVFHDSLLPKYRGFAPIVSAMLCGDTEIGATALFASDEADAGDIILQKKLEIGRGDYIIDIVGRMATLYASMAISVIKDIVDRTLCAVPQDDSCATFSIWRDEDDYAIDWCKSAEDIYNQIRATGYPYKGASSRIDGAEVRIISATVEDDIPFAVRDCGKIWRLENGQPIVVCGSGMLCITRATLEDGKAYNFLKLRSRFTSIQNNGGGYSSIACFCGYSSYGVAA